MRKRILISLAILLLAFGGFACDREGNLDPTIAVASALNFGAPYQADALEQGEDLASTADDFIAEDVIPVEFFAKAYSNNLITNPGGEAGDFLVERYHIEYIRVDGGVGTLPPVDGYTSILVKNNKTSVGSVVLLPASHKALPLITNVQCCSPGELEIQLRAVYTFYGRELSTLRESSFSASVTLNIFDWYIVTSAK